LIRVNPFKAVPISERPQGLLASAPWNSNDFAAFIDNKKRRLK